MVASLKKWFREKIYFIQKGISWRKLNTDMTRDKPKILQGF